MIIRQALPADLDWILSLLGQLGYPAGRTEMAERLWELAQDPAVHRVLLAEDDSGVVGLVHLQVRNSLMRARSLEIVSLVIDAQMRGQGAGTALLKEAEQWAAELNIHVLQLYSNTLREKAHQFYYKNGFTKIKDSIMLKKEL